MVTATKQQIFTEADRQELIAVLAEIERRKRIKPLEFLKLMKIQQMFNDCIESLILLFGGNRSGKTTPVAKKVIEKALEKKSKIWVCGETFQDSVAIQQKKIWDLCPKNEIHYGSYDDINGFTNRKLKFKNGSMITFKSFDQGREAFQSDDIDLIWNDEEPPLDIVKEQRMRLIDRGGSMIISMTSLKGVTELIEDLYVDHDVIESQEVPQHIVAIHPFLKGKILPRVARKNSCYIFFLWTIENEYIDQVRLLEEMRLMSEQEVLSRVFGIPVNLQGKIYISFNKNVHTIQLDDVPMSGNQLWHVLDPHDRKPWAMGWFLVNKNGSIYMVDEYPNRDFNEMMYDDKTYADYAEIIKRKEQAIHRMFNTGSYVKRIIDPNFGNKTVQLAERQGGQAKTTPKNELKKLGLNYIDGIDALEAGHIKVRELLHWQIKNEQIITQPKIRFCSSCFNTITHLSRYSRKDINGADGDVKDKVAPMDKYKDFCDLVRYLGMSNPVYIEKQTFELPKNRVY